MSAYLRIERRLHRIVKICHVTSVHCSDDVRIFKKECKSLVRTGYDTYLVAMGESREESGVHIVGLGEAPKSRIKRMSAFTKRIYDRAMKIDAEIYHLHDPELLPYALKMKKAGKTVIFDSHENTLEEMRDKTYVPSVLRPLVAGSYRFFAKNIFKKLDALVSVTPDIIVQLKELNKKTYMVTNYPILEEIEDGCEKNQNFTLCFTGGIKDEWSHEVIIESLSDGVNYELCGLADDGYIEKLSNLPMWKNVHYFGRVSHQEALKIQSHSHVGIALLQPSRNTGFLNGTAGNTKLFEYMMAGIPVICTDFILWKDIVHRYNCGICVNPNDMEAVRAAVDYLRRNPDEAAQMGQNGRRAVEQEFNWATQEKKLLELYASLSKE